MKEQLKALGTILLGAAVFLALLALPVVFIMGSLWAAERLLPALIIVGWIALGIDILLLLPLSIIRPFRPFTGGGIFLSSYLFGIVTWLTGFIVTYSVWGLLGVIIGCLLMGVGVVPLGIVASLLNGMWEPFFTLLVLAVVTFGSRLLGLAIAAGM